MLVRYADAAELNALLVAGGVRAMGTLALLVASTLLLTLDAADVLKP